MTITELLSKISNVYSIPDDRLYSVDDMLYNLQRFVLLWLNDNPKKGSKNQIENLNIALSWYLAIINRYHIDLEPLIWRRYSYKCPYCLDIPCVCSQIGAKHTQKTGRPAARMPQDIAEWQQMVEKIYPTKLPIDFKQEMIVKTQELIDCYRLFFREKRNVHFRNIESKSAEYFVFFVRIYNWYDADITNNFLSMYQNGCYVCHKLPCECNYYE